MTLSASRLLAVAALAGGGLVVLAPSHAQYIGAPNPLTGAASHAPRPTPEAPPQAPAPAIPGSRATPDTPAPAERLPMDMAPNEALFDAINRGDLAAARDAIARGADLDARNLLGLTPLDLSVDLGRNDISFLLLSMRGSAAGRSHTAAAEPEPSPAPPSHGRSRRAQRQLATAPVSAPQPLPASGGTPVPAAGFLGFDIGRTGER